MIMVTDFISLAELREQLSLQTSFYCSSDRKWALLAESKCISVSHKAATCFKPNNCKGWRNIKSHVSMPPLHGDGDKMPTLRVSEGCPIRLLRQNPTICI